MEGLDDDSDSTLMLPHALELEEDSSNMPLVQPNDEPSEAQSALSRWMTFMPDDEEDSEEHMDAPTAGCTCTCNKHCIVRCCGCSCLSIFLAVSIFLFIGYWDAMVLPRAHLGSEYIPPPPTQISAQRRASEGVVHVLSYNIFQRPALVCDKVTCSDNDFKRPRLDLLIERLDDFDLLLLQESWLMLVFGRKKHLVEQVVEALLIGT